MNDGPIDDFELTDRVGAAIHRLADSHSTVPPSLHGPKRRGRWMLTAAAAVIVALGVGGLVVATRTTGDPAAPVNSGDPAPESSEPAVSDPSIAERRLRFDEPLGDDISAAIEPAPSDDVSAFRNQPSQLDTFFRDFGAAAAVSVLDHSGTSIGLVNVADTDIPASSFADDELETRGGVVVYVDEQNDPHSVLHVEDDVVRLVNAMVSSTDDDPAQLRELAVEVAAYADSTPLDELAATDRFLPIPPASVDTPAVTYAIGDNEDVGVNRWAHDAPPTAEQFRAFARLFGVTDFEVDANDGFGELPESGQFVYVEQISPVDVVTVLGSVGASRGQMEAWVDGLVFDTADALGITVQSTGALDDDAEIVLEGEETWGRWIITETVSDDERCFGFGATVWPLDSKFASASCGPLDDPAPPAMCLQLMDGYVTVERRDTAAGSEVDGTNVEFRGVDLRVALHEVQPNIAIACR